MKAVDDGYWRDKVLGEFRALVPEYSRDLDLKSAYPFRTPEDIEEAVTSFSPFGGKVVVLAGGYGTSGKGDSESKSAVAAWSKLLDELGGDTALVIYDSKLPAQTAKRMTEIDCSRLDAPALRTYLPPGRSGVTYIRYRTRQTAQDRISRAEYARGIHQSRHGKNSQ